MDFPAVRSKADFAERYLRGEFGNASPSWTSLERFLADPTSADHLSYHLRNRRVGGATYYRLSRASLIAMWETVPFPTQWYASAMAPEERKVFQGEVYDAPGGLDLSYSTLPVTMREAAEKGWKRATGLVALALLRHHLCPNSFDWLQELRTRYPGHVVEFSTYAVYWGTLSPRFNTVFWEVRLGY